MRRREPGSRGRSTGEFGRGCRVLAILLAGACGGGGGESTGSTGEATTGPAATSGTGSGSEAAPTTGDPVGTTTAARTSTGAPAETTTDAPGEASSSSGSSSSTGAGFDPEGALFYIDFDDAALGPYGEDALDAAWSSPPWNDGVDEGRVAVFEGDEAWSGRSLRVSYPAGGVGPGEGGGQWKLEFGASYPELYCAYRLRFRPGFDFVKGGKLPGLAGGVANTGGDKPTGADGWSGRMMWREGGQIVQYTYHPDQPTEYGEDMPWDLGGQRHFVPGEWHLVEHRVVMNTPGESDGALEGWLDGELVFSRAGIRFRDAADFAVDLFYFSTFFGGSDASWAPPADTYVDFDEFIVADAPIAH